MNKELEFTGLGKEIMVLFEIMRRDPDFDINKPMTMAFLEDVHSEIGGVYDLNEMLYSFTKSDLYGILRVNN